MSPIAHRGATADPAPPHRRHLVMILNVALAALVSACGLLQQTEFGPDDELSDDRIGFLRGIGVLEEGETVRYFSSSLTFAESGNFVTDRGVGAYWLEGAGEQQSVETARFDEVASATLTYGSGQTPHDILITRLDGSQFHLYVSSDTEFVDAFSAEIQQHLTGP
ncbi:MAG: hypothetical protein ACFCVK_09530 [Acidimicrobiales bacterium]